ncbi:ABC transporter permease [Streptomyces sp. NPDC057950]|uniref:ABC transporter permease n=1 Tax=Streptomyces sp. NPDC057950 TaxID=3346288 RepID=UPI0036ECE833
MTGIALRTLRTRAGGFAGTFIALLLAATILGTCGVLLESGLRGTPPAERYAGASVVVSGRDRADITVHTAGGKDRTASQPLTERVHVPERLRERIAVVPGASGVVADIGFPARITDSGRKADHGPPLQGHNWSAAVLAPFALTAGSAPRGAHDVVLDRDLARRFGVGAGDTVTLMTRSVPERYRVAGIVEPGPGVELARQSVVFFTDATARQLAGHPGTVDAFGVPATPPGPATGDLAARVENALDDPSLSVSTGDGRSRAEFTDVAVTGSALTLLAGSFAGTVFLVAVLVVASTLGQSVQHRTREAALLRAVGATPGQVRRMIAVEATVVALAAGVLGWPLAHVVTHWIRDRFAGHGIVPPDFEPVTGPLPAAGALLITVLTALVAALSASRRTSRIRPAQALGEAAMERPALGRGRAITGAVLLACSSATFAGGLSQRGDVATLVNLANTLVLLLVITLAVLGPAVARTAMLLLGPLLRLSRATGHLAAANTRANAGRLAGAVTPLVLAVSFAATIVFAQTTALDAAGRQTRTATLADHVLVSPHGLPPELAQRARRIPAVKTATALVRSKAVAKSKQLGGESAISLTTQGVTPQGLHDTLDLDVQQGSTARLRPGTVAVSATTASWLGLGLGDTAQLQLGDGTPLKAEVIAVYGRGLGFADLTLAHEQLLPHTTAAMDETVLIRGTPGTSGTQLAADLAALARQYPGTTVHDRLAHQDRLKEAQATAWVNYLLAGMVIIYTGITVVNTLAMNTAVRRREFALLRLAGSTPAQVRSMMRWETAAVVLTGTGLGTAAAALPLILVAYALTATPTPYVPPLTYLAVTGTTALLAYAAALIPTRLNLRTPPVAATRTRE